MRLIYFVFVIQENVKQEEVCETSGKIFPQLSRRIHPVFAFDFQFRLSYNYFFTPPPNESSHLVESFNVGKSALAPRTKASFELTSPLRIEQSFTEPEKY